MDEWLSAAVAYEMISAVEPMRARTSICSRAYDGLVRARAKRLVWGDKQRDDADVPAEFWWARGQGALKQNWTSGDFETWIEQRVHCRAYSVDFLRADIEEMIPARRPRGSELVRSEPGNFASASISREELSKSFGGDLEKAEATILKACRAGLVASRCKRISWWVTDRYGSTEYDDLNVEVPPWFWEDCLQGTSTMLNWSSGRFAGQGFVNGEAHKAILTEVEFRVGDIVELEEVARSAGSPKTNEQAPRETNSRGAGRRQSEKWRPWIVELVAHVYENGFPGGVGSQGQEELINAIANRLAERGIDTLSRASVQPVVQAVLDRLRSAEN